MCVISCPEANGGDNGFLFRPQHICRGGKRWFQDILAKGEHVERGVDGVVTISTWVTNRGDYPKIDVIPRPCESAIHDIIQSRAVTERGSHPGEAEDGRPKQ